MTTYARSFIKKNLYQILVGLILAISNLVTFYTSFQLFQQSTNFRVAAIQNDIVDIKQTLKDITTVGGQIAVLNTNVTNINDRLDRQAEAIKELRNILIIK